MKKLRVWQYSSDLAEKIVTVAQDFPEKERYNLNIQIRRAADSIGLNIAEAPQASRIQNKEIFIYGKSVSPRSCSLPNEGEKTEIY